MMNNILTKIIDFLSTYKWLLLPIIPAILLITFLISLSLQPTQPTKPTTRIPTPYIVKTQQSNSQLSKSENQQAEDEGSDEGDENFEAVPGFEKKEMSTNGLTTYTFSSSNPKRPNIVIRNQTNMTIFSRTLNSSKLPTAKLSTLRNNFGQPERIVKGSSFYGQNAVIYVYGSYGLAFIGDLQSDQSYEEQHFQEMSVEEYIKQFGNQN